jgi:hypothetical protein
MFSLNFSFFSSSEYFSDYNQVSKSFLTELGICLRERGREEFTHFDL